VERARTQKLRWASLPVRGLPERVRLTASVLAQAGSQSGAQTGPLPQATPQPNPEP